MTAQGLMFLYSINHNAIGLNARDLTHEESLAQPDPGGNCANWVLGHIVQNRGAILQMLGEAPIWSDEDGERYKRGSEPIRNRSGAKPFPEILDALDRSQERLLKGLARLDEKRLGSPNEEGTLARRLTFLHFHEAYHVGQLALLRRIAGKPGAIK